MAKAFPVFGKHETSVDEEVSGLVRLVVPCTVVPTKGAAHAWEVASFLVPNARDGFAAWV